MNKLLGATCKKTIHTQQLTAYPFGQPVNHALPIALSNSSPSPPRSDILSLPPLAPEYLLLPLSSFNVRSLPPRSTTSSLRLPVPRISQKTRIITIYGVINSFDFKIVYLWPNPQLDLSLIYGNLVDCSTYYKGFLRFCYRSNLKSERT